MGAVFSLVRRNNEELAAVFRELAKKAEEGRMAGALACIRWNDGREDVVRVGPYRDVAQSFKALAKMRDCLMDDTRF